MEQKEKGEQNYCREFCKEKMTKKKTFRMPHVYLIFLMVMLLVVILGMIVPRGSFERSVDPDTGRTIVNTEAFHYVDDRTPPSVMEFFESIHNGIVQSADVVVSMLLVSGVICLLQMTGALAGGVHKLLETFEGKELLVITGLFTLFTFIGAMGMGESALPLLPVVVSVVMAMGYDRIAGMATVFVSMGIGFTSGLTNMYTTGLAQTICGLPMFSGMGFRVGALAVYYVIGLVYVLNYCRKIKKNPEASVVKDEYLTQDCKAAAGERVELTGKRKLALVCMLVVIVAQGYGPMKLGWGLPEISASYLMLAAVLIVLFRMNLNEAFNCIVQGASKVLGAALAVGLARAVTIMMNRVQILDTMVYALGKVLQGKGVILSLLLVYLAVTGLNFFVSSGSGKAIVMMPIFSPLAKMLKINQQVMVLAYQYGDGFTNYVWPTGCLVPLTFCGVKYNDWIRFSAKLYTILIAVAFGVVAFANAINLGPF